MLKKGSKVYSILTGTCPRCHKESMYQYKNILSFSKMIKMKETCGHCGLKFQIEPSFFYGAMYVSYALNVAIGVAAFIISYLVVPSMLTAFYSIVIALVVLFPFVMRLSRNIYINFFVSYDKNA